MPPARRPRRARRARLTRNAAYRQAAHDAAPDDSARPDDEPKRPPGSGRSRPDPDRRDAAGRDTARARAALLVLGVLWLTLVSGARAAPAPARRTAPPAAWV